MQSTLKSNFNIKVLVQLLAYAYVFMSYNACEIIFPRILKSFSLFLFLISGILFLIMSKSPQRFSIPVFTKWYAFFVSLSFLSMSYSPEKVVFTGVFYWMLVSLFITFLFLKLVNDSTDIERLGWCYAVSAFVLNVTLYLTGNLVGTYNDRLGESLFGNANSFASMIMVALLYELWLIVYGAYKKTTSIILVIFALLNLFALVLSAGRKFFIIPFLFLYFLLFFKSNKNGKRHILKYTFFIGVLSFFAYFVIMNVPLFYNALGYRLELLINGYSTGMGDGSFDVRGRMKEIAIEGWFQSPIWGWGFNSFKFLGGEELGKFTYSHCNYTELLYNGGLIYFISYYWFYFYVLRTAFAHVHLAEKYRSFVIAVIFACLILENGDVDYWSTEILILIAMGSKLLSFTGNNERSLSPPYPKKSGYVE